MQMLKSMPSYPGCQHTSCAGGCGTEACNRVAVPALHPYLLSLGIYKGICGLLQVEDIFRNKEKTPKEQSFALMVLISVRFAGQEPILPLFNSGTA